MFKDIKVPENNELKDLIQELLEFCDGMDEDELGTTYFTEPVCEEEIANWEKENGVSIPESYKAWLRFTGDCEIDGTTASFYSPKNFKTKYVPEDFVRIGEQIGDGEVICFSKETGEIVTHFEGEVRMHYGTFDKVIEEVLRMLGKPEEPEEERSELEKLKQMRKNVLSNMDGSDEDKRRYALIEKIDAKIQAVKGN